MSLGRLSARGGAATLFAFAVTAVFAPAVRAKGPAAAFRRDTTPLPKSLSTPVRPHTAVHAASATGTIARTVAGLAVVLAVVFGIYWLLKTYSRGKRGGKGDGKIEVLATTPLAPNRAVHLLRVGDGLILVGSAEGGVTRLRSYSAEESDLVQAQLDGSADPLWQLSPDARGKRSFVDELRRRTARQ